MDIILRSPIFYMGNKHKLMKDLKELFPNTCETFVDLFGGSGCVSMNYQGTKKTIYNEFNSNIVELIKMIKNSSPEDLNNYFRAQIQKYNLRTLSSQKQDYRKSEENYYKFRQYYNGSTSKDYRDLFLLMCYSINHLLRFNSNNEFNVSNGNNAYNEKNYKQICDMHEHFKNVDIINGDAFDFDFDGLTKNDFIYLDPPYLNTEAVYNEKRAFGGWNIECDYKLFKILEKLNSKGIRWGMSNVFSNRGIENEHLKDWCEKNNWQVYHLDRNYNPFSRGNSNNDEVYICNYTKEIKKQGNKRLF